MSDFSQISPQTSEQPVLSFPDISRQKYFQMQNPKYISWQFYSQYLEKSPPFGDLGVIVFLRTYSRFIESLGRREYWSEVVLRVVEYSLSLEDKTDDRSKQIEAEKLFDMIFNLRGFPAGRTLWVGDRTSAIPSTANFNCSFRVIDSVSAYAEIMYLLMVGAGAGFSVQSKYISKLPKFNTGFRVNHVPYFGQVSSDRQDDTKVVLYNSESDRLLGEQYFTLEDLTKPDDTYLQVSSNVDTALVVIGDSREGWVNGLRSFFTLLTYPNIKHISIDYGLVREKGKKLKTFGGRASGYEPLKQFFRKAEWVIKNSKGVIDSVTAMDLANIIAEVVVVAGVRRCLPKETIIHTQRGLVKLEDLKLNDLVLCGDNGYYPVIGKWFTGQKRQIEFTTIMGTKFICSPDHRVAILKSIDGDIEWKEAKNITEQDRLVFNYSVLPGQKTSLPEHFYVKRESDHSSLSFNIPDLNTDVSWFFGQLHGNGCVCLYDRDIVNSSSYVSIACANTLPENHQRVVQILREQFGVKVDERLETGEECSKPRVVSIRFADYLSQFKKPKQDITIPDFILQGDVQTRASYLAGLFDADGYMARFASDKASPIRVVTTVYPGFAKQIISLANSLGIAVKVTHVKRKEKNWKDIYNIELLSQRDIDQFKMLVGIPFSVRWAAYGQFVKQRVKSHYAFSATPTLVAQSNYRNKFDCAYSSQINLGWMKFEQTLGKKWYAPVPITSIRELEDTTEMYDIEVAGSHAFVAEGLLVHNSSQISIGDSSDGDFKTAKYKLWDYLPGINCGTDDIEQARSLASEYESLLGAFYFSVEKDEVVIRDGVRGVEVERLTRDRFYDALSKLDSKFEVSPNLDRFSIAALASSDIALGRNSQIGISSSTAIISRLGLLPLLTKLYDIWDTTDDRNLEAQKVVNTLDPKFRYRDSRVMSNNSIALETKPTRSELIDLVEFIRDNGEPGLLNYESGRKRRIDFEGVNPCFAGDMKLLCKTGYYTFRELAELATVEIIDYRGRLRQGRVWSNGVKDCIELTLDDSVKIRCTPDHILMTGQGKKQAKDCLGLKLLTFDYDLYNQEVLAVEAIAPQEVFDFSLSPLPPSDDEDDTHWGVVEGIVAHNCAEILLQNKGVCNLTEGVLSAYVENGQFNWQLFEDDIRLLTRMGSRITMVDMWHPEWDKVQKSDRLLGVSLTGQCDAWNLLGNPGETFQAEVLSFAKAIARDAEKYYHEFLGIPRAKLVTTGKPSGSISQLSTCSSGCHQPYAPYYFRTIRISSFDPIALALRALGCKVEPQKSGKTLEEDDTWVFTFPIKTDAQFKSVDESAIAQLNRYKVLMQNFVEHNQSVTISVAPDEWGDVINWLDDQENWESFVGISFLPKFDPTVGSDGSYPKMPYVTCSEEQYKEMLPYFPKLDEGSLIKLIQKYESSQEEYMIDDSCGTGSCPVR